VEFKDLTDTERALIENLRILKSSDPVFTYLPQVLSSRIRIMIERGAKYNGHGSSVMEQIYSSYDQSAFHKASDPMLRLKNICTEKAEWLPDSKLHELPDDAANYLDMWLCAREEVKRNGLSK
jgi:hypothetical protein